MDLKKCLPDRPIHTFDIFVSRDVTSAIRWGVCEVYRDAYNKLRGEGFEYHELKDGLPHYRRMYLEGMIADLGERFFKLGARIEIGNNIRLNAHRRLIIGPVVMTQSLVTSSNSLPREADFRNSLARSSQLLLFPEEQEDIYRGDEESEFLYAMITHSSCKESPDIPEFVNIIFPDRECKNILGKIELFKRHPEAGTDSFGPKPDGGSDGQRSKLVEVKVTG